jgi:hypothetical protein
MRITNNPYLIEMLEEEIICKVGSLVPTHGKYSVHINVVIKVVIIIIITILFLSMPLEQMEEGNPYIFP